MRRIARSKFALAIIGIALLLLNPAGQLRGVRSCPTLDAPVLPEANSSSAAELDGYGVRMHRPGACRSFAPVIQ